MPGLSWYGPSKRIRGAPVAPVADHTHRHDPVTVAVHHSRPPLSPTSAPDPCAGRYLHALCCGSERLDEDIDPLTRLFRNRYPSIGHPAMASEAEIDPLAEISCGIGASGRGPVPSSPPAGTARTNSNRLPSLETATRVDVFTSLTSASAGRLASRQAIEIEKRSLGAVDQLPSVGGPIPHRSRAPLPRSPGPARASDLKDPDIRPIELADRCPPKRRIRREAGLFSDRSWEGLAIRGPCGSPVTQVVLRDVGVHRQVRQRAFSDTSNAAAPSGRLSPHR